jgi:hypothetical protein
MGIEKRMKCPRSYEEITIVRGIHSSRVKEVKCEYLKKDHYGKMTRCGYSKPSSKCKYFERDDGFSPTIGGFFFPPVFWR